eukprot:3229232-Rhodomonas_salina.1
MVAVKVKCGVSHCLGNSLLTSCPVVAKRPEALPDHLPAAPDRLAGLQVLRLVEFWGTAIAQ